MSRRGLALVGLSLQGVRALLGMYDEVVVEAIVGNPILLYVLIALGGLGVYLAMPRQRLRAEIIGLLIGVAAIGGVAVLLGFQSFGWDAGSFPNFVAQTDADGTIVTPSALPNPYFYVFALIALVAGVRMITHPRPVYAALHFILSVLATAGLILLLSAEFMAFALIIIYAGAILITYLFVIMLATQAPNEEEPENLAAYDLEAREPVLAILAGFILIGSLTTMIAGGAGDLVPDRTNATFAGAGDERADGGEVVVQLPGRLEKALRDEGSMQPEEVFARGEDGLLLIDAVTRTAGVVPETADGDGVIRYVAWPEGYAPTNMEELGYDLIKGHPGAIEIAGVLLLMAMLGAVVLARKQIQIDEDAKFEQARALGYSEGGDA